MYWEDQGYILSKTSYNENSLIIEAFTLNHGKCSGIVYGGSSRKQKKNFQIGNKIFISWRSKGENKIGYFTTELIKPLAPLFFDNKKKTIGVVAATSILRILLPDRQVNKKIFNSFELLANQFNDKDWIKLYIFWELSLIKELGYEVDFSIDENKKDSLKKSVLIDDKLVKVPDILLNNAADKISNLQIKEALIFNKFLILENFIKPHSLRLPFSRNILEKYFN